MKDILPVAAGITLGGFVAPMILGAVGVQPAAGFGVDDVLTIAIITGAVILAYKVL